MSEQPGGHVMAVAVYDETCRRLPDGSLELHDCGNVQRTIVALPADQAPWISREEQETIYQALVEVADAYEAEPPPAIRDAIALLQSRLYPTTGDRG